MAVDLPELPAIVAQLVQSGAYTIYSVRGDASAPYLLVTSRGAIHPLSARGSIAEPAVERPLSSFPISGTVTIAGGAQQNSYPPIPINNA